MQSDSREKDPLTPKWGRANFRVARWLTAGDGTSRSEEGAEAAIPIEVGPGGAEAHPDAMAAGGDFGGHFDQQATPRARLAFAQRIDLPTPREVASPRDAGERCTRDRSEEHTSE